jgi:lipoate-protein ligase A
VTHRRIALVRDGRSDPPELDTAISRATLQQVGDGSLPETLRLHRPGAIVAFGPRDRVSPGFPEAVAAARRAGFAAVERLAGGRAAVFHEDTLAFSWATPEPAPRDGILSRFEALAEIVVDALRALGVDARVGEVPGEYCPGEHSVNARGAVKLMGVGQRVVAGAAHVGGVIVVDGASRIRDVLVPVYRHLGLGWNPETVGSVHDEAPGADWDAVESALIDAFGGRFELDPAPIRAETLSLARTLGRRHLVA